MQPTEHELQTSFRGLEDEELLHLAEDLEQLTPAAQRVLHSEVATRGLQIPPASAPGGSLDFSGTIVTVRRFRDVSEAIVARGALEAAGIACFLRNENTVRLDWQVSNAIGGIRLDVLQSDREAAEACSLLRNLNARGREAVENRAFLGLKHVHSVVRRLSLAGTVGEALQWQPSFCSAFHFHADRSSGDARPARRAGTMRTGESLIRACGSHG